MNTTFNINRIILLLKRYFTENKQRELSFWAISIVVFMLIHNVGSVLIYLFIGGFIFAGNSFKSFNHTPSGMHYLLIPATHAEKLTSTIVLTTFYYFAMFLITYTIGTFIGITVENFIFNIQEPVSLKLFKSTAGGSDMNLWNIFYLFAVIQSVFTLGSVYFKRNAIFKTIFAFFTLIFALSILELFLLKGIFGTYHLDGQNFNFQINPKQNLFPGWNIVAQVIGYLSLPFFWIVSYFRLTEKEV